jgi:CelD/BcsL family acetyltransferase involved in cellulose biosynthesis
MLAQPAIRAFHREAARRLQRRGALLLRALRFGDAVAGVLYGFLDRGVTRICVTGFLRAHARRSPGAILYADAIERAHRGGNRLFDFMRGAERYKYRWGASDVARLHRCRVTREAAARPGRSAAIRQAADG